tara:strand:+ start:1177 stop:1377 length:201 start_codon:yes stop_codon:yes gene_type:complete
MAGNTGNHSPRNTMNTKELHQSLRERVYELFLEQLLDDSEHNYDPGWEDVTYSQNDWEEFWEGEGI